MKFSIAVDLPDHPYIVKRVVRGNTRLEYVLEHGRLPGGTTIEESPVSAERQKVWSKLNEEKIVTSAELVNMLFQGSVPDMAEWEIKAFEELAPVYEPDRRKRLTYDVRQKHQRVELIRLSHRKHEQWTREHEEVVRRATEDGLPIRHVTEDGQIFELIRYGVHGAPVWYHTCNINAARTISADKVRPGGSSPFELTGGSVTMAMWDGGIALTNHQEFSEARVQNRDTGDVGKHPTGVAGTLAAYGVISNAQGLAYEGNVDVYYWDDHIAELSSCVASNSNIQVSNHSYGLLAGWAQSGWLGYYSPQWHGDVALSTNEDWHFGYYTGESRDLDEFCAAAPYHLPVYACGNDRGEAISNPSFIYQYHDSSQGDPEDWFSADYDEVPLPVDGGYDGFDCMLPHAVAKNVLAVGSVDDLPDGYSNGVTVTLAEYSCVGPTDDGRVKPDLVANGQSVYTTYTTNMNGYSSENGTSFAAPSVAGSLALIQELHECLYGTNAPLLASTLKALVLHSSDDIGETPGPDFYFGWGLMNTDHAAWIVTNNAAWNSMPHMKEVALNDSDYIEFDVLATANEALKVTMCWTDPEGTIPAYECDPTNVMLINDLDLRVITPDGGTNFPWVLDSQNPTNAAATGDNDCDNVEQVVIDDPTNDWYTVCISHKGTLSNEVQDVSIVVTGNTPTNAPDFCITEVGMAGTNKLTQLEWPGVVGALYQIETSTNLLVSNGWTNANVTLSANREVLDWIDENSELYGIRFYRLKRVK